jgi:hypothetical protein
MSTGTTDDYIKILSDLAEMAGAVNRGFLGRRFSPEQLPVVEDCVGRIRGEMVVLQSRIKASSPSLVS